MATRIKQHLDVGGISAAVNLLAEIVTGAQDAIITRDANGYIITWNPAAEALFGHAQDDVIGRRMSQMIAPEMQPELARIFHDVLTGTRVESYETQLLSKSGIPRDVSATTSPLVDSMGTIIGSCTIIRDISQRLDIERERERAIASLELANEAVVHDLVEPLTRAACQLHQVQAQLEPEHPLRALIDDAAAMVDLADRLADDVLVLHGIFDPTERRPIDPRKLILEVAATVPGVQVEFGVLPTTIVAHEKSLLRASRNLIENAAMHGPTELSGEEAVVYVYGSETPTTWNLDFEEVGTQIADAELEQLFVPRFLTHDRSGSASPGAKSGAAERTDQAIGLAIVKAFAKAHGGTADAEVVDGVGLHVHFTISKHFQPVWAAA